MIDGRCDKHPFETSQDLCNDCGREFCPECLVHPFGPKRAPICLDCALTKSGVRKHAARGKVRSRRVLRKERKLLHKRREEQPIETTGMLTLDDLPMVVPTAQSPGPEVRPLEESAGATASIEDVGADAFDDRQTSIVRPSLLAEMPKTASGEPPVDPIQLRDLTRPATGETSLLEHANVTDDSIREALPEPLADDDAAALVPAGAPASRHVFDPALTDVS